MEFTITEEERKALKDNFAVYLGKKPQEDDLQSQLKLIKEERSAAQKRVLTTMSEKKIPICKSADYGYSVSLINKKRKTAPKATDYLDTVEQLMGAGKRRQVEQETKQRCTEFKEAQTLKLVKLEGVATLNIADVPAAGGAGAAGAAGAGAGADQPAVPRYDEDNASDESE